ncbi:MAG: DUF3786 domain-containing protein [Spirochaetaceae bacterium]|jgi:hypothetical protein|nr:DUF3786 domain-containing protein [Spirochaetaceae bacterium]
MTRDKHAKRGYEVTYQWVMQLLQTCDFEEHAARLGLRCPGRDKAAVDFLGRTYLITKDAVTLTEQRVPWAVGAEGFEYNLKSVLGYYLLSDCAAEPAGDFCPMTHFSHGVFDNRPLSGGSLEAAYKDGEKLGRAGEKLGFTREKPGHWRYTLLPKVPIKIIYYEGDDEYPANIQVLFDKTVIQFYKFEPLAVLHLCFREGLAAVGNPIL